MNKLEKYKQEFSNLKENFSNENLSKEQIIGQLNILQIELTFEIISNPKVKYRILNND